MDIDQAHDAKVIEAGREREARGLMVVSPDGETLALADVASRIPALPVDAKVALWRELVNSGVLRSIESELKAGIIDAMRQKDATVLPCDGGEIQLVKGAKYDYDIPALEKCEPCLAAITYKPSVNKTILNKLAKQGGAVKATIEAATKEAEPTYRLEWKGRATARVEVEDA